MKKITLLLLFLVSISGYSQFPEGFEGSKTDLPSGWSKYQNGTGTNETWTISSIVTTPPIICEGLNSAFIDGEKIAPNTTSEDYLVTPQFTVPGNGELRFYSRQGFTGDQKTKYQVKISTNPDKSILSDYILVDEWDESQMNSTFNICQEHALDISAYQGKKIHLAFVRVFYNQSTTSESGDLWWIDQINIINKCLEPTLGTVNNVGATTATFDWTDQTGATWEIELVISGKLPTGEPTITGATKPYNAINLEPDTSYQWYVRSVCPASNSNWVGPFDLKTFPLGTLCEGAIPVTSLPFQAASNTGNFSDLFDVPQTSSPLCGANPTTTNYLDGNDVFYSYTATESGKISIKMTPTGTHSSIFIYKSCPIEGNCLAGVANTNSNQRVINNLAVTANTTYTIIISSSKANQTVGYTLIIQNEKCIPPGSPVANKITTTTAELSWTNPTGATEWEIAVQPLGTSIPAGAGEKVTSKTHVISGLTPGTKYQFFVRSKCSTGEFSSWSGPYAFNTLICENTNKCLYKFRMTDSDNNGWNGATMQIRQKDIIIETIGSTFTTGGQSEKSIQLCKDTPFDIFWNNAGTAPEECGISVINKFGQTLYIKAAGTGLVGTIVYDNIVNCDTPQCNIIPDLLKTTLITKDGATLNWSAPATNTWDIYVVPEGSPAPNALTTPTYSSVTTNPFAITNLLPDTAYTFYVRVVCSPNPSTWSIGYTFTTAPTCARPTTLSVSNIGKTQANLLWTKGATGDSSWEILLIEAVAPEYDTPPTPGIDPTPTLKADDIIKTIDSPSTSPYLLTGLKQSKIYYYYIRTLCSDGDKSKWAGPVKFNTLPCDGTGDNCDYTFILTDSGKNGWDEARIQVRQNGIVVNTLGTQIFDGGPTYVNVPICNDIPFDLYVTTEGKKPAEAEIKVVSPFGDLLFAKSLAESTTKSILFTSKGNCTAPTCPLPTAINLINVTNTTATFSWTENAVPKAVKWEYAVQVSGITPPLNSAPVKSEYTTTTNPVTVTGLTSSTTYDFYVRSLCTDPDKSTWTILDSIKFNTKAENDDCDTSITFLVNTDENYIQKASSTTKGATGSTISGTWPVCQGIADDDVWFSFKATSKIHAIELQNIIGNTTNLNHTLYSGSDCNTLQQLYCSDSNSSLATNLNLGESYKIRVYTNGNLSNESATFDVLVITPATITNDDVKDATTLTVNTGLTCFETKAGALAGATPSTLPIDSCIGSPDDDVWYKFVATSTTHYIYLSDITGSSKDVNHAVYKEESGNLTLKYCGAALSTQSNSNEFTIGQTYYIRVWSNSAVAQNIKFNICINYIPPPIVASANQYDKKQLIEDILLKTKCANVTNITYATGDNHFSANGIGYFNKSHSNFPMNDGIVLTTGDVSKVPGPVVQVPKGAYSAWPGDAELENIIKTATGEDMKSNDATILEFDFTALGPNMSFNFLFASNEYGQYQCSFSDSFAFLLTNKKTNVKTNIAVVPGTTTPISVVTIRDSKYNHSCDPKNPEFFDKYYGSNGGIAPILSPINFNGNTIPMKASAVVEPGVEYHIKMVIADRQDNILDSAIFLEGGSFDVGQADLGPDLRVSTGNALCPGTSYTINSGLSANDFKFKWLTGNNTVLEGQEGPSLEVNTPGVYKLEYSLNFSTCIDSISVTIENYQDIVPGQPTNLISCNQTITNTVDLTLNSNKILEPFTANDHTVNYFTSLEDANANNNKIQTASAFNFTTNPQTIYARINNTSTGCYKIIDFNVGQNKTPDLVIQNGCTGNNYMFSVAPKDNSFDISSSIIDWTANNSNDYKTTVEKNSILLEKSGTYTVTVTTIEGCSSVKSIEVDGIDCRTQKGISPDGDGKNDNLDLSTLNVKKLEIFNRYGSEVFSLDNYTNQWHGQSNNGDELPDATYFYTIHYFDNTTANGWIYINRKS